MSLRVPQCPSSGPSNAHASLFSLPFTVRCARAVHAGKGHPRCVWVSSLLRFFCCVRAPSPSLALASLSFAPLLLSCHSHCFCPSTRHSCHLCPNLLRMRTHAGQMTHAFMHTQTRGTQSHVSSSCFATAHRSFALSLADQAVVWSSGHTGHRRPDGRRRTACPLMSFLLIALSTSTFL